MSQLEQLPIPTLTDLLEAATSKLARQMNCIQLGKVKNFYAANQTADIQFILKRVLSIEPDGTKNVQELPLLVRIPVMVLFGGNAFLSMPIAAGDDCIILFNDRDMSNWFANGGIQNPATFRTHDFSDAMAIVGLRNLQNSIADYISNGIRLSLNANSRMTITDGLIETIAALFKQNGNFEVTGDSLIGGNQEVVGDSLVGGNEHIVGGLQVDGLCTGSGGGAFTMGANLDLNSNTLSGGIVESSNGATGTYTNSVTVVNGIVTGGS